MATTGKAEAVKRKRDGADPEGTLIAAAWQEIKKEPTKVAALAYAWLVAVGYARTFGTGIAFGVNPLDFATTTDFLTGGLRDPFVVIAAAASGILLLRLWMRSRDSTRWRWLTAATMLALLALTVKGSAVYRHAVIAGDYAKSSWAPGYATVTLEGDKKIERLRLILTTSDELLLYDEGTGNVVLLRRDAVKLLEISTNFQQ